MAKKTETQTLELTSINPRTVTVTIVGDSDLVLNRMNDVTRKQLTNQRKDKAKDVSEKVNVWEQIITSIHWENGNPTDMSEDGLKEALKTNAPCLTAFGLKQSFKQAVTRNKIATYSTEFDATMNVVGKGDGLVPIRYAEHHVDEKLMSPKRGAPVLVYLNRFSGWSSDIKISYLENVYSLEQILSIINLAGFGLGIGSGRTSGYGRYHIEKVEG